jgi:hypothetical protein
MLDEESEDSLLYNATKSMASTRRIVPDETSEAKAVASNNEIATSKR